MGKGESGVALAGRDPHRIYTLGFACGARGADLFTPFKLPRTKSSGFLPRFAIGSVG